MSSMSRRHTAVPAAALLSACCLIFILFQVNTNLVEAINIYHTAFGLLDWSIGLAHLYVLCFHIFAILFLLSGRIVNERSKTFNSALLVFALLSLLAMGVEKVMVDEVAREYRLGSDISELNILNLAYLFNLAFAALLCYFVLKMKKTGTGNSGRDSARDERIFIIAQYMGLVSGLLGLLLTFDLIAKEMAASRLWIYIPFYLLCTIPYLLAVLYWLSLKLRQRIVEWYDEKQFQDILKSSLSTLLLSVPGLAVAVFAGISSALYMFLYYLFLVLLLFSGGTLYFFKLKDID